MLALFKTLVGRVEESVKDQIMPNPLKKQEGGDHYKGFEIQPAEFIHVNDIPYLEGCVIKYLCRHKLKGGIEDLHKAQHYIDLIIHFEYKNQI